MEREELYHKRVEGIIAELSKYFEIHFQQLTRIRPAVRPMYADLLWMQMGKVREVMATEKMFGPVRMRVGDILASRDEGKRRAVMTPLDQASILSQLIPEEEAGERRPGFLAVRNMRNFYTAVDSTLGSLLELADIWLWWDILDAADTFNFHEAKKLIEYLKTAQIAPAMQSHYHEVAHWRDERPMNREEILTYEFAYLEALCKGFLQRRADDKSFMAVIKRDPIGGEDGIDELITTISRHITARQKLRSEGGIDERLREHYARILKCDPALVEADRAVAHENSVIAQLRDDLRAGLERGVVLGEPYDYKRAQSEEMKRDVKHYQETLTLVAPVLESARVQYLARPTAAAAPTGGAPSPAAAETRRTEAHAAAPLPPKDEPESEDGPPMFF